jgi:hypothetical protein
MSIATELRTRLSVISLSASSYRHRRCRLGLIVGRRGSHGAEWGRERWKLVDRARQQKANELKLVALNRCLSVVNLTRALSSWNGVEPWPRVGHSLENRSGSDGGQRPLGHSVHAQRGHRTEHMDGADASLCMTGSHCPWPEAACSALLCCAVLLRLSLVEQPQPQRPQSRGKGRRACGRGNKGSTRGRRRREDSGRTVCRLAAGGRPYFPPVRACLFACGLICARSARLPSFAVGPCLWW